MKKTYEVAIALAAVVVISVAAAVALLSASSAGTSATGQLAVMGMDPAVTASGVTKVTAHFSSVYAHTAGSDMSSGWVQVSGSGTMDLMATGSAQTMAVAKVTAGAYDAFKFNVDSVQVTYNAQQYSAIVASSTLTAQSQSRVLVSTTSTAAALVDMRTFVMNTGSASAPQFMMSAYAVAMAVPPQTTSTISLQVGSSTSLDGAAWVNTFVSTTSSAVSVQATIKSNSLSLSLQNSGTASAEVQEVVVTPLTSAYVAATLPTSFTGSAVFTVSTSGSMQASNTLQATTLLQSGSTIAAGSSTSLAYSGNIALSFGTTGSLTGVVSGQQYLVTVIGANTYASAVVVAQ